MYFRSDLKKLSISRVVLVLFLVFLVVMVGSAFNRFLYYIQYPASEPAAGTNPYECWMIADSTNWGFQFLHTLFWVFPVLTTGFLYILEKGSSMRQFLVVRGSKRRYYLSKIVSTAMFSFLLFAVLLTVNAVATWLIYQPDAPYELDYMKPMEGSFAASLFSIHPLCMVAFYIAYIALVQCVLSLFALGVWAVFPFPNKYVAIAAPVVVFYIVTYVLEVAVSERLSVKILAQPLVSAFYTPPVALAEFLLALSLWAGVAAVLLVIGWFRNKDIL